MKISQSREIEGSRIVSAIGKLEAASPWHAPGNDEGGVDWQAKALEKLVQTAQEYDADALIEVNFKVDALSATDDCAAPLKRICAEGLAVRLARG